MKKRNRKLLINSTCIDSEDHELIMGLDMFILQPGDNLRTPHGPQVKFFKDNLEFSITVNLNEKFIRVISGDYKNILNESEINILLSNIKKYKIALLNMWYDKYMSSSEFKKMIADINLGKETKLVRKHYKF